MQDCCGALVCGQVDGHPYPYPICECLHAAAEGSHVEGLLATALRAVPPALPCLPCACLQATHVQHHATTAAM
jgi:hypothetical protein